ncbi:MAG: hypothetical protein Q8Q33_10240 [Chlamydiota bacterium]|nr:hypothetical protein [Chlamydiota bacterium]
MAKKVIVKKEEKFVAQYPSMFGSHASMIDEAATAELKDTTKVACKGEHGIYITERNRLDNGLADPNRYNGQGNRYEIS